jgi:two-component system nitrogen regulation sensor histidine kinase NtrY
MDDRPAGGDLVIAIALASMVAVRLTQLWLDRRRGAAGSRLHMRLVLVCSVFTITPTLIVAIILSLLFINLTDFVVKPARPRSRRRARSASRCGARARRDPARHRAISAPLQELGHRGAARRGATRACSSG